MDSHNVLSLSPAFGSTAIAVRLSRQRGLADRLQAAGVAVLIGALGVLPAALGISVWLEWRGTLKAWGIDGPACPVVARISTAGLGARPPPAFVFQGVRFDYQIADVSCAALQQGLFGARSYPVCRFTAPAAIRVTTDGRTVTFEPGVGHGATVAVRDGRVSCAMRAGVHG